ncbi:hypothetical protein [Psychrobacillus sp. MER TA 171]|uniref:hypothetical protein n=1 Tax=Psychrobacillus sp. MER TA 171 TaxID=2939577 RepID=UPI002040A913|nr:hypothetical protein [Psychrobacillus sp. MER TA 171]MCM3359762.1 hypothetical protein [Psychrobacillus sp. MER TA 171]
MRLKRKRDSYGIKEENETADRLVEQGHDIEMCNEEVNCVNGYGIKEASNPDFLLKEKFLTVMHL